MNISKKYHHFVILTEIIGLSVTPATAQEKKNSPLILDYYDIETIPLPKGEASVDAITFLPNGRLACALSQNKISIYDPVEKAWSVFAEGLQTPLGLLASEEGGLIVAQVPEITLLRDRDNDGRADEFKTISDHFGLSGNYAEFNFSPVRDAKKNLFFGLGTGSHSGEILTNEVRGQYSPIGHEGRMNSKVPYRGWIMKISPDGKTTPFANGFREPNGLGFDPDGRLLVTDNQGDFVGASKLYHVRQDGFYGHPHSLVWQAGFNRRPFDVPVAELDRMRTRAAIVFPYGEMSNSPAQPLADATRGLFGPFAGQVFVGEMNMPRLLRVMLETVNGELQGAATPFFDNAGLHLGNNRLAFHPTDGSLWIGQTKYHFWPGESGLQRLIWKGIDPMAVQTMKLTHTGFDLTFTRPLADDIRISPEHFKFSSYYYNYHEKYGSDKYDITPEEITGLSVSKDRKTVSLSLKNLRPWRLYDLKIGELRSQKGHSLTSRWVVYTLNQLIGKTSPPPPPSVTPTPSRRQPKIPAGGVQSIGNPQHFPALNTPSNIKITREHGTFRFTEKGQDILVYRAEPVARADGKYKRGHYIHPLYDLDGTNMTDDMPQDHPHHRGIFWAWTQLWIGDKRIGHPWEQRGLEWNIKDIKILGEKTSSALAIDVQWLSPLWTDEKNQAKPIISEHSIIRIHEATNDARIIDFEIQLLALEDNVRIGGSLDPKGYGGFSARIPLPDDLQAIGPDGAVKDEHTKPSAPQAWIDFTADFSKNGKPSGLAILCHPSTPGFPQGWTVRKQASCQNPVFPGSEPITLPRDKPLTLRYRLILHRGNTSDAGIAEQFKRYAAQLTGNW